jgi:hypothetical protein
VPLSRALRLLSLGKRPSNPQFPLPPDLKTAPPKPNYHPKSRLTQKVPPQVKSKGRRTIFPDSQKTH